MKTTSGAALDYNIIEKHRKYKSRIKMNLIMDYLEQCFKIMMVVVAAELLRRFGRIIYEYFLCGKNYDPENRLLTIVQRCLSVNFATSIAIIVFLIVAVLLMTTRNTQLSIYYFSFMPLYWIFMTFGFANSHMYYADFIRESHGLDYAEGMASNYFHGYLKLILPTHTGESGLRERMELYESEHNVTFALKRLFIMVPNTLFINSKIESDFLQKSGVHPLETVIKNRAGVARPFKNDVYRFNEPLNGKYYYVAMEGATPMLSFFEALNFQPSTTWQMKEMKREILLKFCKHLKYLLNKWPETQGKAEVVLYNSYEPNGQPQDVGKVLLSHITNLWNQGQK
ncbi:hypothetical protein DOY81_001383 [Sarcophaga bullata]|nr:hypothetical protein DOY81_001383 [Sarcophaga bullata]